MMNNTEKTDVVASAIAHHIRTRGFDATKLTVEQIIGEASKYDSYGTDEKMWVKEIRERHAASFAADAAYRELLYVKGANREAEATAMYLEERKLTRWVRKVTKLALAHVREAGK